MRVSSILKYKIIHIGRYTEIEKANRILLERMTSIMQTSNRNQNSSTPLGINKAKYKSM
jgi:hypothetical protein